MNENCSISPIKVAIGIHSFEYSVPPFFSIDTSTKPFLKITEYI